MFFVSWGL